MGWKIGRKGKRGRKFCIWMREKGERVRNRFDSYIESDK